MKILKICLKRGLLKPTFAAIESIKMEMKKNRKPILAILVALTIIGLCYFVKSVLLKNSMSDIIIKKSMQMIIYVIAANQVSCQIRSLALNINQQKSI